jgi:hypothetical protein
VARPARNGAWGGPATWGCLPRANADGEPVVPLTPEQRYTFDTQGGASHGPRSRRAIRARSYTFP